MRLQNFGVHASYFDKLSMRLYARILIPHPEPVALPERSRFGEDFGGEDR